MSTFDGFFRDQFGYTIRADRFTLCGHEGLIKIQLLSHVHSDHTVGLASKDFRGTVICSEATKAILLRTATASERVHYDVYGVRSEDYYTFKHLQQPVFDARGRQVIKNGKKVRVEALKSMDLDVRHDFTADYGSPLAITLINANHCPGAVMFLIESPQYTILYTGDVRAEPFLINQLVKNPLLSEYLCTDSSSSTSTMDCIYLDTAGAMTKARLLTKTEGVQELLNLFDMFPENTRFFLNVWTFGYEELLRGIALKYKCKIHMDEYKIRMYSKEQVSEFDHQYSSISQSAPTLSELCTSTFQTTRFHACERRWKCPHVREDGLGCFDSPEHQAIWEERNNGALETEGILERKGVKPHIVFVNPSEATYFGWAQYRARIKQRCQDARDGKGVWPKNLMAPLARHSTLPELRELVALFHPRTLYPNTIYPEAHGQDYLALSKFFASQLALDGKARLAKEAQSHLANLRKTPTTVRAEPVFVYSQETQGSMNAIVMDELENATTRFGFRSGRLGEGFIKDNYDHLEDDADVEALLMEQEEQEAGESELVYKAIKQTTEKPEQGEDTHTIAETALVATSIPTSGLAVPPAGQAPGTSAYMPNFLSLSLPIPASPRLSALTKASPAEGSVPSTSGTDADADSPLNLTNSLGFLVGHVFYFCKNANDNENGLLAWQEKIENEGGAVIKGGRTRESRVTALRCSHLVVCERREGWEFHLAIEERKYVGNAFWLSKMFDLRCIPNPEQHLLWYPTPPRDEKCLDKVVVTSTGFSESQKRVIQALVGFLGGQYSSDLAKNETEVLITASSGSRKCSFARKWSIPIVNFLWIEDCYLTQKKLSYCQESYSPDFILDRRVGERNIKLTGTRASQAIKANADSQQQSGAREPHLRSPLQPTKALSQIWAHVSAPAKRLLSDVSPKRDEVTAKKARTDVMQQPGSPEIPVLFAGPESFQSTSTSHEDDTQQIRNVQAAFERGLGIPRLISTEHL